MCVQFQVMDKVIQKCIFPYNLKNKWFSMDKTMWLASHLSFNRPESAVKFFPKFEINIQLGWYLKVR